MSNVKFRIRTKHFLKVIGILLSFRLLILIGYTQPTRKEVYNKLLQWGVAYPNIVMKQAVTETNCGKTGVGKSKNNLFGFKNKAGYLKFDNWIESIAEYKYWQDKHLPVYIKYKGTTKIDYYDFIWWSGYRDGRRYSSKGKSYVDFLKDLKVTF